MERKDKKISLNLNKNNILWLISTLNLEKVASRTECKMDSPNASKILAQLNEQVGEE